MHDVGGDYNGGYNNNSYGFKTGMRKSLAQNHHGDNL
jgi:hypothetical protein